MTYSYRAKSGITVTSCEAPQPDFRTNLHYLAWSYRTWGRKIIRSFTQR